jgi:hypothetical protein
MKKLLPLLFAFVCISVTSCRHRNHDLEITYSDADHEYSMVAYFNNRKMREVEYYLNRELGTRNNISFSNTRTNATFTLDDQTTFYLQKDHGHIKIKMDKDENSRAAYRKMKSVCEGMKLVLTR